MSQANASSIAPATGVGPVHVAVTDADRALMFYEHVLGLRRIGQGEGDEIRLGAAGKELVVLHPGAAGPVTPHRSGLYHLAIVVPTRRDLAVVIRRLLALRYPNSPTDHVLTKADYLWDLDGNGIEVYVETPEDGTWLFDERTGFGARDSLGRPRSGRDPIDLDALLGELDPADAVDLPLPAGTRMGHVHLHVGHLGDAVDFYHGLIGFDLMGMSRQGRMAFVSAGGYHHHLGLNTWAGEGAPPPPPGTSGLRRFTIELPTAGDLDAVLERLRAGDVAVEAAGPGYEVLDPSQNIARLVSHSD
ncbi:MAG: glyoxalase [Chloroflexi bacterium]|nr:MAG: glyoxalase [Chloroflexota bacterium]